jgi:hypothetical protein
MQSEHKSFIHDLQIASPCKADWDSMTGDEQKRFCAMCKLNVYNISEMTLEEAEKLVSNAEGRTCIRMYRRADGTVITKDCPVGLAAKVRKRVARTFAIASAVCAVVIAWAGNLRLGNQPSLFDQLTLAVRGEGCASGTAAGGPGRVEMGDMVAPPVAAQAHMGRAVAPRKEMGKVALPVKKTTTDIDFVE